MGEVLLYDHDTLRAEEFADAVRAAHPQVAVTVVDHAREAVERARLTIAVTTTTKPYVELDWLPAGGIFVNVSRRRGREPAPGLRPPVRRRLEPGGCRRAPATGRARAGRPGQWPRRTCPHRRSGRRRGTSRLALRLHPAAHRRARPHGGQPVRHGCP
ncbi:hypothetical protein AB0D71_26800 [Streptomyces avermitilis]|uniref:hypothetical protein n=1 Tax=Streptomyces avermitilis TaxID=33903 RepID=UPI0033D3DC7E